MSTKKDRISKGLAEIGASFEGGSDRYFCLDAQCRCQNSPKRMYHVAPGYGNSIDAKAFANLDEIAGYIQARKSAEAEPNEDKRFEIMQDFWDSLDW